MENKKSVLLYCDLIHTVEKMDDLTAGKFFKHYLRYVNDLNPISDDILIEITFESVKQNLKRDLVKWSIRAEKSRQNGSKGGRPTTEEKTQKTQQVILKPKKPVTDTVTVTVTDTVTVKDITFKKSKQNIIEKKAIEIILPFSDTDFEIAWLNWKEFKLKEKRFKYASPVSEAMALKSLVSKSNNNSNTAIKIIEQAIEFGWSGFFPLKNIQNGNSNQKLTASEQLDKLKREFDERIDSSFIQQPIENSSEDVGYVCLE